MSDFFCKHAVLARVRSPRLPVLPPPPPAVVGRDGGRGGRRSGGGLPVLLPLPARLREDHLRRLARLPPHRRGGGLREEFASKSVRPLPSSVVACETLCYNV